MCQDINIFFNLKERRIYQIHECEPLFLSPHTLLMMRDWEGFKQTALATSLTHWAASCWTEPTAEKGDRKTVLVCNVALRPSSTCASKHYGNMQVSKPPNDAWLVWPCTLCVFCHSTECATADCWSVRAHALSEGCVRLWEGANVQREAEVSKCDPLSTTMALQRQSNWLAALLLPPSTLPQSLWMAQRWIVWTWP